MRPTYEEMLEGACKWKKNHKGVTYELSFHGYRKSGVSLGFFDDGHEGIWCYYLYVPEQMYPHRFADFETVYQNGYGIHGPAWEQVEFNTEITWASNEVGYNRNKQSITKTAKVGCDYNHLWHGEAGYPDTYYSVNLDAINTVESFLKVNPDYHLRCNWSGVWGPKEDFYECVGGWMVHKDSNIPDEYDKWKRKVDDTST